ncbi:hypothetical protein A2U01_0090540, partial [Trifolium medium]|nr:hypothetical protein [Trifolium medium]
MAYETTASTDEFKYQQSLVTEPGPTLR